MTNPEASTTAADARLRALPGERPRSGEETEAAKEAQAPKEAKEAKEAAAPAGHGAEREPDEEVTYEDAEGAYYDLRPPSDS